MASSQANRFYNMPPQATSQPGLIPFPENASLLDRHGIYDLNRAAQPPQPIPSPEPSPCLTGPFNPDPSWGLLEPDISLKQALNSEYTRSKKATAFSRRRKTLLIVASLFPTLAATAQLLLLLYLLDAYVSLPQTSTGARPRISPVYSIWPYIACVGSIRGTAYRTFGFLIASFYVLTFIVDMIVNWDCRPAKWLRWSRLLLSCVSGGTLIAVVYASEDFTSHVHLYLVSVQAISFTAVKGLTWAIDHELRRQYPLLITDRNALFVKRWRYVVYLFATPIGALTIVGIYACHNTISIQTKGTSCYVLSAISAICDWLYQLISVPFLLSLAYDLYQAEHFARVRLRSEMADGDMSENRRSRQSKDSRVSSVQYQQF